MSPPPPGPSRAAQLFRTLIRAILCVAPREIIWRFLERVVLVPSVVGSRASGPLDTSLMPQWRGLLELYARRRVHFFTLCKAARIGGTLFFGICLVIEKILRWPGPIGWLDPTRKTAARVSRQEIQPYLVECAETNALRIPDKKHWTTLEMVLKNCIFSILGAGSINDLGGRQWELVILNEQDRIPNRAADAPTPSQEAEARSSQFLDTRKIVRNSTPFREAGLTWGEFLAGSQHHCYVPCPHCGGYQRLTFFPEPGEPDRWFRVEPDSPFLIGHETKAADRHGIPLRPDTARSKDVKIKLTKDGTWIVKGIPPTGRFWWPPEAKDRRSNRWNVDLAERGARYECVYCQAKIRHEELVKMNERYDLRAHNIHAPKDHISVHLPAHFSPWTTWGATVKQWLLAQGVPAKLHALWNLVFGLPFTSAPTKITPKHLAAIQHHSPRYERQFPELLDHPLTLHIRPVCLSMHVDVQQDGFWYTIRAWLPDGARHVLAWGQCGTTAELDRIAAREWLYDHGETRTLTSPTGEARTEPIHPLLRYERFTCYTEIGGHPLNTCVIDTGYKAKRTGGIYEFLHEQAGKWKGVRGGKFEALGREKPIFEDTVTFNFRGEGQVDVAVIKQNDFILQEHLSRFVLKERRSPQYCLPINLDDHLVNHLTSPHLTKRRLADGRTEDIWAYECDPHLYDCEKYAEVLGFILEPPILQMLREKQDALRTLMAEALAKTGK